LDEKNNQTATFYQKIIFIRRQWQEMRIRLEEIRHAFALEDVALHGEQGQHDTIKPELERERRLWRRLEAKLEVLDSSLSHHMDEFAQRAAMEESLQARKQTYDANRQARSAGQLTKIATIIVPCTFVASIFSMGGSFAAGEDLFYVYWAVSLPITAALLVWVLQLDIREWWTSRKTDWRKKKARLRGIDLEGGRKER
jgi:Mg2+ and Co2+ transporter CorA